MPCNDITLADLSERVTALKGRDYPSVSEQEETLRAASTSRRIINYFGEYEQALQEVQALLDAPKPCNSGPTPVSVTKLSASSTIPVLSALALDQDTIQLTWTTPSESATGYGIERSEDSVSWIPIATLGAVSTYDSEGLTPSTLYYYRVRSLFDASVSNWSNIASATTNAPSVPAAPSALVASPVATNAVLVEWEDNATDETSLELEISLDGVLFTPSQSLAPNSTFTTVPGLLQDTLYYFRVQACNGSGCSAYSNVDNTRTFIAEPTGLNLAVLSNTEIDATWTDPHASLDRQYDFDRALNIFGPWTSLLADTPLLTYLDTGRTPSTNYFYRVRVKGLSSGQISDYLVSDATTSATALVPPTNLVATAIDSDTINLSWDDNAFGETGYAVERSLDGISGWALLSTEPPGAVSYVDNPLDECVEYFYRVKATGPPDSGYSNVASSTTPADPLPQPTGLVATAVSYDQIDLTWTDNAPGEIGYVVERSLDGVLWGTLVSLPPDSESYSDTSVSGETTYFYRVQAICSTNELDFFTSSLSFFGPNLTFF